MINDRNYDNVISIQLRVYNSAIKYINHDDLTSVISLTFVQYGRVYFLTSWKKREKQEGKESIMIRGIGKFG